jgi:hypothetical protein
MWKVYYYYIWIFLEGTLVEKFLVILGDIYFIISCNFGMVKTLIHPYLLGFDFYT